MNRSISVFCAAAAFLLSSCGRGANTKTVDIALVTKALDSEYWQRVKTGADEASRANPDVRLAVLAPEREVNIDQQVSILEDQITKHVAAPAEGSPLKKVADAYLAVQKDLNADKLGAEHTDAVKTAADSLEGEKHKALRSAAEQLARVKDIAAARAAFRTLSGELIKLLQETGQ